MVVMLVACSDRKGYWLRVNVLSVEGTTVCFRPVSTTYWQDFPPSGAGCLDGTSIDLSKVLPGRCVVLRVPNSPGGKLTGLHGTC